MKKSCCLFVDFLLSLLIYTGEYLFFFLFDTWCYIYFGAPISTKFRSILLPHSIKLVRTCWVFSCLSYMKEMKHGNGEQNSRELSPVAVYVSERSTATRRDELFGLSHRNVQDIGIKYLYFRKKISERVEMFFDARFIFQGHKFYMFQRLLRICFTPNLFCCKHIE